MQHAALQGDDPGAGGGDGDVRVDRVIRVEVDKTGLHGVDLGLFVGVGQLREFRDQRREGGGGAFGGHGQLREAAGQTDQAGVIQALGADGAGARAQGFQDIQDAHVSTPAAGPLYGYGDAKDDFTMRVFAP